MPDPEVGEGQVRMDVRSVGCNFFGAFGERVAAPTALEALETLGSPRSWGRVSLTP